jgi:hypothetical protein
MSVPWRFILALPLGLILGIAIFIGLLCTQLGIPTESSHYIYDVTHAKELIAAKKPGSRLLIVAGSSALFGFNTELIEKETGYPTVNVGTAVGLNLDYRFYRIKKIAHPGDIILLACEYELYSEKPDYETADDYILARDPGYFYQMPLLSKIYMATRIPFKRFQLGWRNSRHPEHVVVKFSHSPYNPFSATYYPLNGNGDEMLNTDENRPPPEFTKGNLSRIIPTLLHGIPSERTQDFASLAEFIAWAHAHQITVLATFPNVIHQPVYDEPPAREAIATITHFYASHGVPVVGTAQEVMLPPNQFFDYMYHLTHEAALKRTERLIPELQPYLHPPN